MDKFPPEILHKVFIQLDLQQRFVCLTICRSWWRVLDKYSLFYNIKLLKEGGQFNRIMDMFERLPDRAAQVEELHIEFDDDAPFNRRKLFSVFPNARKLEMSRDWDLPNPSHFTEPIDLTHFKAKVQYLADIEHCELVSQMLYSNLGGRLKELDLNFHNPQDRSIIVSQLRDLSVLKKLSLWSPNIEFPDLEHLHKHVPSIQDFTLGNLTGIGGDLPSDIVPAISITKLKFHYMSMKRTDKHAQIYQYMTKKYTSITDIDYEDEQLPYYDFSYRRQIYLNGLIDFYKLIGPTQRELNFSGLPNGIDVFDALDAVGSQIKEMHFCMCDRGTLLQYLIRSKQSRYLETLDIFGNEIESLHLINTMSALTTLILSIDPSSDLRLHMTDVLAACPSSLKKLYIRCHNLKAEPSQIKLNSIENLLIESDVIRAGLLDTISSCFPNLVNLHIIGEVEKSVNITLTSAHLQKASFDTVGRFSIVSRDHAFSFKSPAQTETEYFICHWGKKSQIFGQKRRVKYDDVQDLPILSVVSLTEKRLEMDLFIEIFLC